MKVLVTGGTGFVGRNVVNFLKENPIVNKIPSEITVLTRNPETESDRIITEVQGDLTDPSTLKDALDGVSTVFHLASLADDWASWNQLYKVNVEGTGNLADAFLKYSNGDAFVHIGSAGIYGHYIPAKPVNEDYAPNPTSIYQKSKLFQEHELLKRVEDGLTLGILRPPSIIGSGDTTTTLPAIHALEKRAFPQVGNGKNFLTFVNVLDLISGMILVAENLNKFDEHKIWNIFSFKTTLKDYHNAFLEQLPHLPIPKKHNFRFVYSVAVLSEIWSKITRRKSTLNRYRVTKFSKSRAYDMTRIQKDLGYKPRYDLQTSIKQTVEWLIAHNYLESPAISTNPDLQSSRSREPAIS